MITRPSLGVSRATLEASVGMDASGIVEGAVSAGAPSPAEPIPRVINVERMSLPEEEPVGKSLRKT